MYKFLNKIRIKTYSANNPCRSGGFTIVELLVTTTIFVLITSISLVKNAEFNSSISITNLAYEVALQIREAQSYGVSVKEFGVGTGNFDVAYGVYFIDSVNDSFIFFADENKNEKYNASNGEFIDQLSTIGGNEISMFCATPTSGPEVCSDDGSISELVILFQRPKPDAIINTNISTRYSSARIVLVSSTGSTREIVVQSIGQIAVRK